MCRGHFHCLHSLAEFSFKAEVCLTCSTQIDFVRPCHSSQKGTSADHSDTLLCCPPTAGSEKRLCSSLTPSQGCIHLSTLQSSSTAGQITASHTFSIQARTDCCNRRSASPRRPAVHRNTAACSATFRLLNDSCHMRSVRGGCCCSRQISRLHRSAALINACTFASSCSAVMRPPDSTPSGHAKLPHWLSAAGYLAVPWVPAQS